MLVKDLIKMILKHQTLEKGWWIWNNGEISLSKGFCNTKTRYNKNLIQMTNDLIF